MKRLEGDETEKPSILIYLIERKFLKMVKFSDMFKSNSLRREAIEKKLEVLDRERFKALADIKFADATGLTQDAASARARLNRANAIYERTAKKALEQAETLTEGPAKIDDIIYKDDVRYIRGDKVKETVSSILIGGTLGYLLYKGLTDK